MVFLYRSPGTQEEALKHCATVLKQLCSPSQFLFPTSLKWGFTKNYINLQKYTAVVFRK